MASVERRTRHGRVVWLARWRDPDGRQRSKSFAKKGDADRYMTTVAADVLRGSYIDPQAGKVTFREYAQKWLEAQTSNLSTREQVARRLRLHAIPTLGHLPLSAITPSTIQTWLRGRSAVLAPRTVQVTFANVSSILGAAVDDEILRKNPCSARSVRPPKAETTRIAPWTTEAVQSVWSVLSERYRIVVTLGAGLGLRAGEIFGLSPDDIDFLRGTVTVRRQVKTFDKGKRAFAPPKHGSIRAIPLPESVKDALAAHLAKYPARAVSLPWVEPDGEPVTVPLVITSREGSSPDLGYFRRSIWKPALAAAGVAQGRMNGLHALRHFYASVLLDAGESIKALSEYLGHRDPGFTLRTYTHLMPASEDRTKRAVDAVLGSGPVTHTFHETLRAAEN